MKVISDGTWSKRHAEVKQVWIWSMYEKNLLYATLNSINGERWNINVIFKNWVSRP